MVHLNYYLNSFYRTIKQFVTLFVLNKKNSQKMTKCFDVDRFRLKKDEKHSIENTLFGPVDCRHDAKKYMKKMEKKKISVIKLIDNLKSLMNAALTVMDSTAFCMI